MENYLTIRLPNTKASQAALVILLGLPGVSIETDDPSKQVQEPVVDEHPPVLPDEITVQEAAEIWNVTYYTARQWVVDMRRIKSRRPSGKIRGKILVKREDVLRVGGKRQSRKKGGVSII